jgi:hypothetical protein
VCYVALLAFLDIRQAAVPQPGPAPVPCIYTRASPLRRQGQLLSLRRHPLLCRLSSMVRTQWCRITTLVPLRKSTRPHTAKQYWSDMCLRSRGNRRIYLHGQCVESFWTCLIWLTGLGESRPQASVIIQSGLSGSRSIGSRSK